MLFVSKKFKNKRFRWEKTHINFENVVVLMCHTMYLTLFKIV